MNECIRYTSNDINHISNTTNSQLKLPQEAIDMITSLADQVGAPTYVKTPQFNKDRKKRKENGNEEWAVLRNFKATEIVNHASDVDKTIDTIRMAINKMTDETKEARIKEIKQNLNDIKTKENYNENINKISNIIFDIACGNKFYSNLYAELLLELMTECPEMKDIFNSNLSNYLKVYEKIDYVDANTDYEQFCVLNKENENRRALSTFLFNLVGNKLISNNIIHDLLDSMRVDISTMITQDNKKYIIDEIMENIMIFITGENAQDIILYNYESKDKLLSYIRTIAMMNANTNKEKYPSLSSKLIFKCEDILDILEDDED